jgi:serine protease DegQ
MQITRFFKHYAIAILTLTFPAYASEDGLRQVALPIFADDQPIPSLAPVLEKVTPAVVNISTTTLNRDIESPLFNDPFFRHFFSIPSRPKLKKNQSLGSGVIINAEKGYVVTNHHVIDKAVEIFVTLQDGRELKGELIGSDSATDVALLKIPNQNLTALKLADSDKIKVGDFVVAIGSPFGLSQTVTSGIISALGRSGLGIEGYEDFIQTDASINPGNSGGPLINLKGQLIGINTAILAPGGGNVGIGFAIPINMVSKIVDHLSEHGEVQRGVLGIEVQDIKGDLANAFNLQDSKGAAIVKVRPDSAAQQAGFQVGDIITHINGKIVNNSSDVRNRLGLLSVGETVEILVNRQGKSVTLSATIAKDEGVKGAEISKFLDGTRLEETEVSNDQGKAIGILLKEVKKNTSAWEVGLRTGDIILSVNRVPTEKIEDLKQLLKQRSRGWAFTVLRNDSIVTLMLR